MSSTMDLSQAPAGYVLLDKVKWTAYCALSRPAGYNPDPKKKVGQHKCEDGPVAKCAHCDGFLICGECRTRTNDTWTHKCLTDLNGVVDPRFLGSIGQTPSALQAPASTTRPKATLKGARSAAKKRTGSATKTRAQAPVDRKRQRPEPPDDDESEYESPPSEASYKPTPRRRPGRRSEPERPILERTPVEVRRAHRFAAQQPSLAQRYGQPFAEEQVQETARQAQETEAHLQELRRQAQETEARLQELRRQIQEPEEISDDSDATIPRPRSVEPKPPRRTTTPPTNSTRSRIAPSARQADEPITAHPSQTGRRRVSEVPAQPASGRVRNTATFNFCLPQESVHVPHDSAGRPYHPAAFPTYTAPSTAGPGEIWPAVERICVIDRNRSTEPNTAPYRPSAEPWRRVPTTDDFFSPYLRRDGSHYTWGEVGRGDHERDGFVDSSRPPTAAPWPANALPRLIFRDVRATPVRRRAAAEVEQVARLEQPRSRVGEYERETQRLLERARQLHEDRVMRDERPRPRSSSSSNLPRLGEALGDDPIDEYAALTLPSIVTSPRATLPLPAARLPTIEPNILPTDIPTVYNSENMFYSVPRALAGESFDQQQRYDITLLLTMLM